MAMTAEDFADELVKYTDPSHPDFVSFPATPEEVAKAWMSALKAMFEGASNPPSAAAAAGPAAEAGVAAMAPLVLPPTFPVPIVVAALGAGYAAFAGVIAAQNAAFQAIPPPATFVPVPGDPTGDPYAAALVLGQASLDWAATGLADPPPDPPTSPWS